jgi:hypothetical protein
MISGHIVPKKMIVYCLRMLHVLIRTRKCQVHGEMKVQGNTSVSTLYLFHFLMHTGTKQTKYIGVFVHKSVVETELERCVVSCVFMKIRTQIAVI